MEDAQIKGHAVRDAQDELRHALTKAGFMPLVTIQGAEQWVRKGMRVMISKWDETSMHAASHACAVNQRPNGRVTICCAACGQVIRKEG
jgi:hypothetical protein